MKKNRLGFYTINERYIEYLKRFDQRVPDVKYNNRDKFFAGALFKVNGAFYFAPVSSYKQDDAFTMNEKIVIDNKVSASVRCNYMIPVPEGEFALKDFSTENNDYQYLVRKELEYCQTNQQAIVAKGKSIYLQRSIDDNLSYDRHCCNFNLLEAKCNIWEQNMQQAEATFDEDYPSLSSLIRDEEKKKLLRSLNSSTLAGIDCNVRDWIYYRPNGDHFNSRLSYETRFDMALDSWIHGDVGTDDFIRFMQTTEEKLEFNFDEFSQEELSFQMNM